MKATFLIEDLFNIQGKGAVITGKITNGIVKTGMKMEMHNVDIKVASIESYNKIVEEANTGDSVGILLENSNSDQLMKYTGTQVVFTDEEKSW